MPDDTNNSGTPALPYYVATYKGRSVAIKRDSDYQATIKLIQKSIAKLRSADPQDIIVSTALADYGDAVVQISEEIWPDVVGNVKVIEIALEELTDSENATLGVAEHKKVAFTPRNAESKADNATATRPDQLTLLSAPCQILDDHVVLSANPRHSVPVILRTTFQTLITLDDLPTSATAHDIKTLIENRYRIPAALQRLDLGGTPLDDQLIVKQSNATRGIPVDLILNTRKSLVYLLPAYSSHCDHYGRAIYQPIPLQNITIQLSVNRKWELAALWPRTEAPCPDYIQTMSWNVDVRTENALLDHHSKSQISWLSWDGSPSVQLPSSDEGLLHLHSAQLSSALQDYQLTLFLNFDNSVAIPFNEVESYLKEVLYNLRDYGNSFSVFVSSCISAKSCSHVAFRFAPPDEYQHAGVLSVVDHPETDVICIVLLYKRLDIITAAFWDSKPPYRYSNPSPWQNVIDPMKLLQTPNRSKPLAVNFTFLEVP